MADTANAADATADATRFMTCSLNISAAAGMVRPT
jgi:hypothetical protein